MVINNIHTGLKFLIFCIVFCPSFLISQSISISGFVFDQVSKKPLEGVVIYVDGTTRGTVTNSSGKFSLDIAEPDNAKVIVSYLGYEIVYLEPLSLNEEEDSVIYLKKKLEALDEVYLDNDDWSRKKKLKYFRAQFIGNKEDQKTCKILNEDKIRLYFNKKKNILYASSKSPIRIKNNRLGYDILYDMVNFEIRFDDTEWVESVYFSGTTYFTEFVSKVDENQLQKRQDFYQGSVLHFMRALATNTLAKNEFELFYEGYKNHVKTLLKVVQNDDKTEVHPLKKRMAILFKKKQRTDLILNVEKFFLIDGSGNFSDHDRIMFSGDMSNQKMARLLPLDYGL